MERKTHKRFDTPCKRLQTHSRVRNIFSRGHFAGGKKRGKNAKTTESAAVYEITARHQPLRPRYSHGL